MGKSLLVEFWLRASSVYGWYGFFIKIYFIWVMVSFYGRLSALALLSGLMLRLAMRVWVMKIIP